MKHRNVAAVLLALGACMSGGASAQAAVYELEQCTQAKPGYAGWTPLGSGQWIVHNQTCSQSDGALLTAFSASATHNDGDGVYWRFAPPTDTSLATITTANRAFRSGTPNPGGYGNASAVVTRNSTEIIEDCVRLYGCTTRSGPQTYPLQGASEFSFGVQCSGINGCPADTVYANFSGLRVSLNDDFAPSITGFSGSLTSSTSIARVRKLHYTATDRGGGVFRRRLVIDDVPSAPAVAGADTPSCVQPFTARVPCPLNVAQEFEFDTAMLTDGEHQLALRVSDATDVNVAQTPTWDIKVDNLAPSLEGPTVTGGSARVGESLSCTVRITNGQSPTVGFGWLRANPDGTDPIAIAGATSATYTATDADVGRKLLCRVTATDGGGATVRTSTATDGPFANGAVVQPGPAAGPGPGPAAATTPSSSVDGAPAPHSSTGGPTGTPAGSASGAPANLVVSGSTLRPRRSSWARSAFSVSGRLTNQDGRGISAASIELRQVVGRSTRTLQKVESDATGAWRLSVPRGPSRTVVIAARVAGTSTRLEIRQTVVAHVTLRPTKRRHRRGALVSFRGRLRGGYSNTREKLVEFQVYYRRAWRTISTVKVDRAGRFRLRYRFGTAAFGTFAFRARTLPTDGYPFTSGASGSRAARVLIG